MRILEGHSGSVRCLAYHPLGDMLASGGEDGGIVLWRLPAGTQRSRRAAHKDWVRDLAFSPDGKQLASAGWDDRVLVYQMLRRHTEPLNFQYEGGVWCLAYSASGCEIAIGDGMGTLRVHSFGAIGCLVLNQARPITGVAFTRNGRLLSASHDGAVRFMDGWVKEVCGPQRVPHGWIYCLALSSDDRRYAVGTDEGRIFITAMPSLPGATWQAETLDGALVGHSAAVTRLAFTPDGQTLVSASRDGVVQLWDVATQTPRAAFDWGVGPLYSLAVAPDGMTAAVGAAGGQIVVWDLEG